MVDLSIEDDLQPAVIKGNAELLQRVAVNLLDNAMAHNLEGGRVEVQTRIDDGWAVLRVSNTGPLVPKESLITLFEPFRRRGQDRTSQRRGHGLGLSIVAALVKAHGGSVEALSRQAGGLDLYVRLPGSDRDGTRTNGNQSARE